MPNKTEVKSLPVDDLRAEMSNHFEGITEDTTKVELVDLVDEHWDDWLEEAMNTSDEPETEEDNSADEELADWAENREAFLRKDLYTGNPPV